MRYIKHKYRFVKVHISELYYLEADKNHTIILTQHHKFVVRAPMTTVIERINCPNLVRISRSFAVNILHIEEFNENEVVVAKRTLSITSGYREDFLKRFDVI